jgi:hypothetical protein
LKIAFKAPSLRYQSMKCRRRPDIIGWQAENQKDRPGWVYRNIGLGVASDFEAGFAAFSPPPCCSP